jgi:dsDNA-specific endonuclease/ATPase MutS2
MNLIKLSMEKRKKLILIDELEAITEPGSAAKIIGEFLNILNENEDCFVVLVTHLGEEILKIADVRCDGIEASGLDDNLDLIVDRQPVFYKMGKSTPELIVEKLYKKSKNREKDVFERVLKRLKE